MQLFTSIAATMVAKIGFTEGDIAVQTVAAKMMSGCAIANGGGVPAGSVVSVLQSIGTGAGLSALSPLAVAAVVVTTTVVVVGVSYLIYEHYKK
ncbi:interferon_alpha-inducible protein [Hexamita inflata]|uniref:Interferon alpha-inducible protein n=1 Tax=Hexamita inflata TaxID=28002 RepID=A0AA86PIC1_9EUKA|nr:interferon alpha-inducible protein [Hexamita inflata]